MQKPRFEDCIDVIDKQLLKFTKKWRLKAIPWIDYDDVCQIIRLHLYNKWEQYNQEKSLEPWLNVIISNQITNLIRNLYGNFARPCISCPANQGGDLCSIYSKQCSRCPLFNHWQKNRKSAHDTKLPLPLDNHEQEVYSMPSFNYDIDKQVDDLHKKMFKVLTPIQYRVYKLLYIDGKSESEVIKLMGYKTSEKGRNAGYKTIPAMRKIIIKKAKSIIEKEF